MNKPTPNTPDTSEASRPVEVAPVRTHDEVPSAPPTTPAFAQAMAPESDKVRSRRQEDQRDSLFDLLPSSDAGMPFPEILAAAGQLGYDDFGLQQALDELEVAGRASRVVQSGTLAYRRIP